MQNKANFRIFNRISWIAEKQTQFKPKPEAERREPPNGVRCAKQNQTGNSDYEKTKRSQLSFNLTGWLKTGKKYGYEQD
jgi:hypothetical protein